MDLLRDFLIAAGGGFGGGLIVLIGDQLATYWRRPVINPSFDRNRHHAVVITETMAGPLREDPSILVESSGTYFRLNVANDGRGTAKGCQVAIERIVRTQPMHYEYHNDPITLGWSLVPKSSIDLHPTTSRFCDILVVRNDSFQIASGEVPTYLGSALADSFNGAEFRITLRVSGDNFPSQTLTVICGWNAGVQNIVARAA